MPAPQAPTAAPEPDTAVPEQVGRELLTDVLRLMGIRASVESKLGYELADEGQPPPLVLNITGPDLGILIGRRGETLRALQYLVRLMVSHRLKQWTNLVVDVEDYLVRRRRALESLARRTAERAVQTGRTQALEPMPAYERRWVHIALRNHPLVTTQSIGEGDKRKVTVIPKK
ncbi:MAG TPA: KH domain-containing protein [Anaerolineae bacterium]|nr:KH domain-containing protein [Anaerolineae bacterium]